MKTNDFHLGEREKLLQMPHANVAVAQQWQHGSEWSKERSSCQSWHGKFEI